jgi:hypothetical protein
MLVFRAVKHHHAIPGAAAFGSERAAGLVGRLARQCGHAGVHTLLLPGAQHAHPRPVTVDATGSPVRSHTGLQGTDTHAQRQAQTCLCLHDGTLQHDVAQAGPQYCSADVTSPVAGALELTQDLRQLAVGARAVDYRRHPNLACRMCLRTRRLELICPVQLHTCRRGRLLLRNGLGGRRVTVL